MNFLQLRYAAFVTNGSMMLFSLGVNPKTDLGQISYFNYVELKMLQRRKE